MVYLSKHETSQPTSHTNTFGVSLLFGFFIEAELLYSLVFSLEILAARTDNNTLWMWICQIGKEYDSKLKD